MSPFWFKITVLLTEHLHKKTYIYIYIYIWQDPLMQLQVLSNNLIFFNPNLPILATLSRYRSGINKSRLLLVLMPLNRRWFDFLCRLDCWRCVNMNALRDQMSLVVVSFHLTSHCCSNMSGFPLARHIWKLYNGRYIHIVWSALVPLEWNGLNCLNVAPHIMWFHVDCCMLLFLWVPLTHYSTYFRAVPDLRYRPFGKKIIFDIC